MQRLRHLDRKAELAAAGCFDDHGVLAAALSGTPAGVRIAWYRHRAREEREVDIPAVPLEAHIALVARVRRRLHRHRGLDMPGRQAEHLLALAGVGNVRCLRYRP